MPGEIVVVNPELKYVFVNQTAVSDPQSREWVIGKTDVEYCIYKNRDLNIGYNREKLMREVLASGKAVAFEETMQSDGEPAKIYARKLSPIFGKDGKIIYIVGYSVDITDQKKKEFELRHNEQRLNLLSKLARTGSFEFDLKSRQVLWSLGTFEIFEKDPLTGSPSVEEYMEHVVPEDRATVYKLLEEILHITEQQTLEYRIITYKNNIKYVKVITQSELVDGVAVRVIGSTSDITEQKLTEQDLRLSRQNLEEAQDLARLGSWRMNLSDGTIWWSEGCYKIWERGPEDSIKDYNEFIQTVHPDDRAAVIQYTEELYANSNDMVIEYRIITPSGNVKNLYVRSKSSKNQEGKTDFFFGTVMDLTEIKQVQEKYRQSEESLTEAQMLARMGSWEYSAFDNRLTWSKGMYNLWQRNPELPPPTVSEFCNSVDPKDRFRLLRLINELLHKKESQEIEFCIRVKGNKCVNTYSRFFVRTDKNGIITGIHGTVMDISERKRNEEILQEKQRILIEAQEMSRSGNFTLDLISNIAYWSPGIFKILGLDPEKAPPSQEEYISWMKADDREKFVRMHERLKTEGGSGEIEYSINVPSGKEFTLLARAKGIPDSSGKIIRISGTITDITPQAEAKKILVAMKEQSDEMIRAKEYFLANISHELKTPLNGILGMARLLQKTDLNTTQRKYTEILNSTAGNLLVIINDILDVAKIESGKLSLEKIPFDPLRIADTAVQVQLYKAEEKDLALKHIQDGKPLPVVIGDPYRLNQILLNLLSNAIKFTASGEVILRHRIVEEKEDEVTIEFSVTDTGIGISADKLPNIFESFMQVHETTQEHYGGTGLGLTISRTLVEMQGGSIHVESEAGKGSRFYFTIPYKVAGEKDLATSEQQRIDVKKLGALRILLAEDNRVNQFITEAMLLDWGFKVDVADNGLEAVEMIKRSDYDLVLMDIQMPGMSGSEATKAIRSMEDTKKSKVPIIALTANTTKNAQRKFIAEGMNDCLVKPFKEETLFRRIIMQLEGQESFKLAFKQPRFPVRRKPVPSGEQLYNLDLLRRDTRNNSIFIRKMLRIFLDTIPPIVERMNEHFENGEMDAISTLAHKIKPTIDGTGISSLYETIRNMENYREKKRTREQMQADLLRTREVIGAVTAAFLTELEMLAE